MEKPPTNVYKETYSDRLICYTGTYNVLHTYLCMFYKIYMNFIQIHTNIQFYHSFSASHNKYNPFSYANCFHSYNKILYWPNTQYQIKFQHKHCNRSIKFSLWGTFITVTLTKFFLSTSPVQVGPYFSLGVIFDTWICFVVQTI